MVAPDKDEGKLKILQEVQYQSTVTWCLSNLLSQEINRLIQFPKAKKKVNAINGLNVMFECSDTVHCH